MKRVLKEFHAADRAPNRLFGPQKFLKPRNTAGREKKNEGEK